MNPNTNPLLISVESTTSTVGVSIKSAYTMKDPVNIEIKRLADSLAETEEIDVLLARIKHEIEAYDNNLEAAINADGKMKEIVHNQYIQYQQTVHNQYILDNKIRAQEFAHNQEIWDNLLAFKESAKTSNLFAELKMDSLLKEYYPIPLGVRSTGGDNTLSIIKSPVEPLDLLREPSIYELIDRGESAIIPLKDAMSAIGIEINLVGILKYIPTYLLYRVLVNLYCPYGGVFILMNLNRFLQQDIQFV